MDVSQYLNLLHLGLVFVIYNTFYKGTSTDNNDVS